MADKIFLANESTVDSLATALENKRSIAYGDVSVGETTINWISNTNIPINYTHANVSVNVPIINGYAYLFGSNDSSYYKYAYKYSLKEKTYTRIPDIPYSFRYGCVVNVGTDIYLFGGGGSTTTAYKYDTTTDTYTVLTTIPYAFQYGSAVVDKKNGLIHLLGDKSNATYHYIYDISSNTYTSYSTLPFAFYYGSAVINDNGDIYIVGSASSSSYYKYLYCLYAGTTTWISKTSASYNLYCAWSYIAANKIYVFGGNGGNTYIQVYDIVKNTWSYTSEIPYNFYSGGGGFNNGKFYLFGGAGSTAKSYIKTYDKVVILPANSIVKTNSTYLYHIVDGEEVNIPLNEDGFYSIPTTGEYHIFPDASFTVIT